MRFVEHHVQGNSHTIVYPYVAIQSWVGSGAIFLTLVAAILSSQFVMGVALLGYVTHAILFLILYRQSSRVWPNPRPMNLSRTGSFFSLANPLTYTWSDPAT